MRPSPPPVRPVVRPPSPSALFRWAAFALTLVITVRGTARSDDPEPGASRFVADHWFQHLGSRDGSAHWLYPHPDGVTEIFRAPAVDAPWDGDLGSRFDPRTGAFVDRFRAAATLVELEDESLTSSRRRRARRLLAYWLALHGDVPSWIARVAPRLERSLDRADREWFEAHLAERARWKDSSFPLGTSVDALDEPRSNEVDEFYRHLVRDGYLDVAIVGGNSWDAIVSRHWSPRNSAALDAHLEERGFERDSFLGRDDAPILEGVIPYFGTPVRVRVISTPAGQDDASTLRANANFVEGLAHADVFIFHGHSNGTQHTYFTSENRGPDSRFHLGGDARDLDRRCHGFGDGRHRLIALQSCSSFQKYCLPILARLDRRTGRASRTGVIGLADNGYFIDIAPRFAALLDLILAKEDPVTIGERLSAICPAERSPPVVLRGFLQARHRYIVPPGVAIEPLAHAKNAPWIETARGSDGEVYPSIDAFPAHATETIVEVVLVGRSDVLALRSDGRIFEVSSDTGGAAVEWPLTRRGGRFTSIAPLRRGLARPSIFLIDTDGTIVRAVSDDETEPSGLEPPEGSRPARLGHAPKGSRIILRTTDGRTFEWHGRRTGFVPLEGSAPPRFIPSLTAAIDPARVVSLDDGGELRGDGR